jgi:hypothetical protein
VVTPDDNSKRKRGAEATAGEGVQPPEHSAQPPSAKRGRVQLYTAVHVSTITTAVRVRCIARPEGPVPVNLYMYTHVFVREYSIRSHGGLRVRAY